MLVTAKPMHSLLQTSGRHARLQPGNLVTDCIHVQIEARVKDKTPYVVVALQEAARMNTLLSEMKQSMDELLLGLGGSLNMSDKMEKLAVGTSS